MAMTQLEKRVIAAIEPDTRAIWFGDRAMLTDQLGRPPVEVDRTLVRCAQAHDLVLNGWTGVSNEQEARGPVVDEVWDEVSLSTRPPNRRA